MIETRSTTARQKIENFTQISGGNQKAKFSDLPNANENTITTTTNRPYVEIKDVRNVVVGRLTGSVASKQTLRISTSLL
jgi:hypothetical protein